MPEAANALIAIAMASKKSKTVVSITESPKTLEIAHQNLVSMTQDMDLPIHYYPSWDLLPTENAVQDAEIVGQRFSVLQKLSHHPCIIVTCIQALMQRTLFPKELEEKTLTLDINNEADLDRISVILQKTDYDFVSQVVQKGQASMRGGLLDVWSPINPYPIRIEFFGDSIETIRSFDPATQRSLKKMKTFILPPAGEWNTVRPNATRTATLVNYLPQNTRFLWQKREAIAQYAISLENSADQSNSTSFVVPFHSIRERIKRIKGSKSLSVALESDSVKAKGFPRFSPLPGGINLPPETFAPDVLEQRRHTLVSDMMNRINDGNTVTFFFDTDGAKKHFTERIKPAVKKKLQTQVGAISEGFICEELSVVVVAESDLYGRRKTLSRKYMPTSSSRRVAPVGTRVTDFTDMEPGDLVVHVEYGIGRYLGQKEILFNNQRQEVLAIEYADNAKLYVPMSQSHLLSRYVGVSRHAVRLHRLSGKRWSKEKSEAQQSILDMAAELLDVQAARDALRGHTFPKDNAWQHEFENSFPFRETPDQYTVIRAVKRDMESKRPMDRLVCGDAGYGKTEVAVRAAFKAVNNGKQAAMLVPTTVLAQQHYNTFTERMSGYPFTIHNLSRFRTSAQRTKTIEGLKEGTVDIVIGTHALLQPNISFKDLGLVIIDEEQRFGVEHKERLKKVKQLVDVLTLTATPIPRTLYMSMTGARDMSLLQTPPRERMAIETIVTKDTNETIRKAILREVNRDGQVFFLYNRVQTIQRAKERLMKIVPDVRIAVAHGQMKSSELSSIMRSFSAGEYDLLLCTTIIESGMDIPRVNTILIDRADRFGLADLYQLRGRVGRSRHKAYAYLLLPSHGFIESNARERIGAIRKHSGLGAGFNLALRDLEIRGSGNILGAAQSGHITAIGFGLYCQLLKRSIANLKGEKTTNIIETEIRLDFIRLAESGGSEKDIALIPYEYIQEEAIRIGAYRRIAEATDASELKDLKDELHDRFGPSPPSVDRLIRIAGIRLAASKRKIQIVDVKNGKVRLFCNGEHLMESGRFPELSSTSTDEKLNELLCIIIDQN